MTFLSTTKLSTKMMINSVRLNNFFSENMRLGYILSGKLHNFAISMRHFFDFIPFNRNL